MAIVVARKLEDLAGTRVWASMGSGSDGRAYDFAPPFRNQHARLPLRQISDVAHRNIGKIDAIDPFRELPRKPYSHAITTKATDMPEKRPIAEIGMERFHVNYRRCLP